MFSWTPEDIATKANYEIYEMLVCRLPWVQSHSAHRTTTAISVSVSPSQPRLTNPISFYDKVSHLADERKAVDVIYLHFRKALDLCLPRHSLGGRVCAWLRWAMSSLGKKNSLNGQAKSGGKWSCIQLEAVTSSPGLGFGAGHV